MRRRRARSESRLNSPTGAKRRSGAWDAAKSRTWCGREIARIPPLLRHALVLREVKQLPMPKVAEELGISIAAAKSRLLRARHELRNRLEKYCGQMGQMGAATLMA